MVETIETRMVDQEGASCLTHVRYRLINIIYKIQNPSNVYTNANQKILTHHIRLIDALARQRYVDPPVYLRLPVHRHHVGTEARSLFFKANWDYSKKVNDKRPCQARLRYSSSRPDGWRQFTKSQKSSIRIHKEGKKELGRAKVVLRFWNFE